MEIGEFFQFLIDNWNIVKANAGLFFTFALLCWAVAYVFYEKVLYRDMPERRELKEQVEALTRENQALQEENRRLHTNEIFLNGCSAAAGQPSIGDKIAGAVSK